ncbi:MAG: tandem-95 repeat protein [Candidatus Hydrogenedentes bacterium]|nr:tandem-95 repeat protein [Candidatus Hydrogenedentota bacterium]
MASSRTFSRCLLGTLLLTATLWAPSTYAQPAVESTLDDALVTDADSDSHVDRGDTIEYTVILQNSGDADAQAMQITVPLDGNLTLVPGSVKIGPIALDDTAGVAQAGMIAIPVLDNDRDVDGTLQPATVQIVQAPTAGSTSIDTGTGVITYTSTGVPGPDTFRYTVEDNDGIVSRQALVTVLVNTCPIAQDDAAALNESATSMGNVLSDNGNGADSDADAGATLTVTKVNGDSADVGSGIVLPSGALLTLNSDGAYSYDPNGAFDSLAAGESDTDAFGYTLSDGLCEDAATVTLTINGENNCPVAQDDAVSVNESAATAGDVLIDNGSGADSDPDTTNALTITEVNGVAGDVGMGITLPSSAVLTQNSDGTFTYDPNGQFEALAAGESDTDSFTYTVSDGTCTDIATVTATINGENDCPVAADDAVNTTETAVLNGDVLVDNGSGADSDTDTSNTLTVTEVDGVSASIGVQITLTSGALLTLNANGTFAYDPNGVFDSLDDAGTDTDSFAYTLSDGACADTATVTVTIKGENTCPIGKDDAFSVAEKSTVPGNVLDDNGSGADSDPDTGDTFTVTELNGSNAAIGMATALPSGALVTLNSDGTFTYDPNGILNSLAATETGADNFTYTIFDTNCTGTATVTITINGANDCPTAQDDAAATGENTVLNGDVLVDNGSGADTDPDSTNTLTITEVNGVAGNVGMEITLPSGALLTLNSNGAFAYDPNGQFETLAAGAMDSDTFAYTLSDGTCTDTATVTLTINGANDCPTANDDSDSTDEDTNAMGDVFTNDTEPDTGDSITVSELNGSSVAIGVATALPSGAQVTLLANGNYTYNPLAVFQGLATGQSDQDSFTYTITDGDCTDTATVTIDIAGVSDAPTAAAQAGTTVGNVEFVANSGGLTASAAGTPAVTSTLNLEDGASDPDTATGSLSVVASAGATTQGGSVSIFADGSFAYTPPAGFSGSDTFTYQISDGVASSAPATVTMTVGTVVWFINNTGGGSGGTGVTSNPFRTVADFNAANGAGAGKPATSQRIYLANTGTDYTTGITLLDNQTLEGGGVALVVDTITLLNAGTRPVITSAVSHGVTLASGNTLRGFNINNTPGFFKISGGAAGTVTIDNLSLTGTGGAINISTSAAFGNTVTFDVLESSSSPGSGINLVGVTGAMNVSSGGVGINGTTAASAAVNVSGGTVSLSYAGDVSKSNAGALVSVAGGHTTGAITFNGTLNASNGTGLQFDNADSTSSYNFNGSTTLNGGDAGIDILNGSSGTFSFGSSTSIINPTGTAFNLSSSNANVTYSGSISDNTGFAIDIDNHDSGTVTFQTGSLTSTAQGVRVANSNGGAINVDFPTKSLNTGANAAVTLTTNNTGGTVNFGGGGLDIDTTSATGFNATGGGTISVTGANNSINSSSGAAAVNVQNTTIGATGLVFTAVTSTGGSAPGIVLINTGSTGGLSVTGDGGGANNGSGGTISGKGGDFSEPSLLSYDGVTSLVISGTNGVFLSNTSKVSLDYMNITGNNASGVFGHTVNGFQMTRTSVSNNGDLTTSNADELGVDFYQLTGTASGGANPAGLTNCVISNNKEFELQVSNSTGTLADFRLTGDTISSNNSNTLDAHGNLVNFLALGSAVMTLTVTGGTYTGNANPDGTTATGIQADHSGTSGTVTANISGATFTDNNAAISVSAAQGGSINFDVNGNTATENRSHGLNLFVAASSTGTVTGKFQDNIVGTSGVSGSGSSLGFGIRVQNEGSTSTSNPVTVLIDGNTVREMSNFAAINVNHGIAAQAFSRTTNVTIRNNVISDVDNSRAIIVQENNSTAPGTINASISNNNIDADSIAGQAGDGTMMRLRQLAGGTVNVTQLSPSAAVNANELDDANSVGGNPVTSAQISVSGTVTFGAAAPPLPLLAAPGGVDAAQLGGLHVLTQAELDSLAAAAIAHWSANGLNATQVSHLRSLSFEIADMPGSYLGTATPYHIIIDEDAAGYGWFIDPTPLDDNEFPDARSAVRRYARPELDSAGRMDLLSAIMHEMGHALGLDDSYTTDARDDLMHGGLTVGERRLPSPFNESGSGPPPDTGPTDQHIQSAQSNDGAE